MGCSITLRCCPKFVKVMQAGRKALPACSKGYLVACLDLVSMVTSM